MKKSIFSVALAALVLVSCQVELENGPELQDGRVTLKASIEQLSTPTKADMDGSYNLLWATGDKIGIFVNDVSWDDKNQPFTLSSAGGSSSGSFAWDYGDFTNTNATVAFFPWQGQFKTGVLETVSNMSTDGYLYFNLIDAYYEYTSGKMLTPLVAQVTYSGAAYEPIAFKHAGAAVKVTINNLPAGAHSIAMGVVGQQLWGWYKMNPANAGTDAIAPVGAAIPANNVVWLNYEPSASERPFTFIFPTPALTTPALQFWIYDENGVVVWKTKLAAQAESLGRGDVLLMPARDITPYEQFNSIDAHWTVIGTANGTSWDTDFKMVTDGTLCIAKGLTFAADGAFKVRLDEDWGEAYPASNYDITEGAGSYDIIFNTSTHSVTAVRSKCPYPTPDGFGKGSDLSSAKDISSDAWSKYYN